MSSGKTTGSCLCGNVTYEYDGKPPLMVNCHCSMCRHAMGASFGTFVRVPKTDFHLIKTDTLKSYRSSNICERFFCSNCGAHIKCLESNDPEGVWITAGTVIENENLTLKGHSYYKFKASWIDEKDKLPKADEGYQP